MDDSKPSNESKAPVEVAPTIEINETQPPQVTQHQKPKLEVLANDSSSSSISSSPVNTELDEIIKGQDDYRKSFYDQYHPSSASSIASESLARSKDSLNSSVYKRASSVSTYGMHRTLLAGPILYENATAEDLQLELEDQSGRCHDCSRQTFLNKFGDVDLCEVCTQKRWQIEVNELIKVKSYLENTADEMKKYLGTFIKHNFKCIKIYFYFAK
jgi:hypothetical protein